MWYFLIPNLHLFLLHLFICISFDMSVIGVDNHFLLQLGALERISVERLIVHLMPKRRKTRRWMVVASCMLIQKLFLN